MLVCWSAIKSHMNMHMLFCWWDIQHEHIYVNNYLADNYRFHWLQLIAKRHREVVEAAHRDRDKKNNKSDSL